MKRAVARSTSTYTLDTASRAPLLFCCCCCNQNELMSTSRIVSTSTRDHRPLTTTSMDSSMKATAAATDVDANNHDSFLFALRWAESNNDQINQSSIPWKKKILNILIFIKVTCIQYSSLLDNTTNYPVVGCIIQNRKHPEKSHVFGYLVCGWWSNFENGRLWKWIMWEG